jgi:ABC-type nitrate/sulfonate/bicarbonate transport system substrate-binding protein
MTKTTTRLLQALGLSLAVLTLIAPATSRAEPLKIRVAYVVPVTNLASILFAKDGTAVHNGKSYVVEALRFQASTPQISGLATGDLDIALLGFTSMPLAIENAGMEDLRAIVGEIRDGEPGYYSNEYAVLADGPVRKPEDLKGKVLATNAIGSAVDVGMRAMLRKRGLEDKRDYTVIEAPFPTMRGLLGDRKADLVPNVPPFSMHPEMLKLARPLFTQADGIGAGELGLWVARTGLIAKHRAALTDLLEDYLRAVRFYIDPANQKEAAAIGANFTKLPVSAFETWLFTRKDYYRDPAGRIDVGSLQTTYDVQKDLGFLKTNIDAKRYVDLSVIEDAAKRLK